MTTTNQDFTMWQGETKTLKVPIVDGDGSPVALTGATIVWQMYRHGEEILDIAGTLYDAAATDDGVQVAIVPSDTISLAHGVYRHEARATVGAVQEVLFEGSVTLKYSETKD